MTQPEVCIKMSKAIKEARARTEVRLRYSETMARPEYRRKMSEASKAAFARPDVKLKHSAAMKAYHALPEVIFRRRVVMARPDVRFKISMSQKTSSRSIAHRARLRRAARPNGSERRLYAWLDEAGVAYLAEHAIGRFFADVYVPSFALVIECDGHYHTTAERHEHDRQRDEFMLTSGLTVLRVPSQDIDSGVAKERILSSVGILA